MVVSVKKTTGNPYYLLKEEDSKGFLKSKEGTFKRRQDCPKVWELNGAIYIIKIQALLDRPMSEFSEVIKYVMSERTSTDIDSQLDWDFAEFLLSKAIKL